MPRINTAQQIKDIIEPIPADKFQTDYFGWSIANPVNRDGIGFNIKDNGKSCFLGHIHRHFNPEDKIATGDRSGYGARQLTEKFLIEVHDLSVDGSDVNNSPCINGYKEPEIKDRIMHLLDDMIKAGY